eukprot:g3364.t1 g3364   contig12:1929440-1930440(-)
MYNGIGLQSVRGTATSGHVQHNAGHVRNSSRRHRTWRNATDGRRDGGGPGRGGNGKRHLLTEEALKDGASSLALHEKKRQLEVRLLELRDRLEEEGRLNDDDIDLEVGYERKRTLERWENEEKENERRRQMVLERQQAQLKHAEGGGEDGEEGVKLITQGGDDDGSAADKEKDGDNEKEPTKQQHNNNNSRSDKWERDRRWDNSDRNRRYDNGDRNRGRHRDDRGRGGKNAQAQMVFQEERNEKLRDAFGIRGDQHKEGEAFDRELQQAKRDEKQKRKEQAAKAQRKAERANNQGGEASR